jgi:hypothetical protein
VNFKDDLYLILHGNTKLQFINSYKLDAYFKDSQNLNEKLNFKYLDKFNCNLYFKYNVKLNFKHPYEFNHHLYPKYKQEVHVCPESLILQV